MVHQSGKEFIKEFEHTIRMAELRVLNKVSLERPLTDAEYGRMMRLKKEVFGEDPTKSL